MKLSAEEKQQRKIAREESKRLEEQRKEEALKLEMEEFFKEFPWRIDEEERWQKLRQEALSKLSPEERAALEL